MSETVAEKVRMTLIRRGLGHINVMELTGSDSLQKKARILGPETRSDIDVNPNSAAAMLLGLVPDKGIRR